MWKNQNAQSAENIWMEEHIIAFIQTILDFMCVLQALQGGWNLEVNGWKYLELHFNFKFILICGILSLPIL